jgi:hypothetical protein
VSDQVRKKRDDATWFERFEDGNNESEKKRVDAFMDVD